MLITLGRDDGVAQGWFSVWLRMMGPDGWFPGWLRAKVRTRIYSFGSMSFCMIRQHVFLHDAPSVLHVSVAHSMHVQVEDVSLC